MLVIRLFRTGKKNQPSFKIVITDKQNPPRGGRFVEEAGFYNPVTKEKVLKQERLKYWISQGAQPSSTVHNLLVKEGILQEKKIPKHKKSKPAQGGSASDGKPEEKMSEVEPPSPSEAKPSEGEDEAKLHRPKTEEPKTEEGL